MTRWAALVPVALMLLVPGVGAQSPPPDAATLAATVVRELASRDFAAVEARFTPAMTAALPPGRLAVLWNGIVNKNGPYVSTGAAHVTPVQGNQVAQIVVKFAGDSLVLTLSFNPEGKLAGFFQRALAAHPEPAVAVPGWAPAAYVHPQDFHSQTTVVGVAPWALPAVLTLPTGPGPFPAVVLVQGSGPSDEDETIGPNKPFKDLAEGLASQGVAVLRYAKRTYFYPAESAAAVNFTVMDETVTDARAAAALLSQTAGVDPHRIFVLGHSLGGMLAPRIADHDGGVAGIILLAASAQPLQQSIVMQMRYLAGLHPPQATPQQVAAAEAGARAAANPALKPGDTVSLAGATVPASYLLDLRAYDPLKVAATLRLPVLVLQGARDYQVTTSEFHAWQQALAANPRASFRLFPNLTHLFIAIPNASPASPADYAVAGHVDAAAITAIATWVRAQPAQ